MQTSNEWCQAALNNILAISILVIMLFAQTILFLKLDCNSFSQLKKSAIVFTTSNISAIGVIIFISFFKLVGLVYIAFALIFDFILFFDFINIKRGEKYE